MAAPSAVPIDRPSLLASVHTKVTEDDLGVLSQKYDIPAAFELSPSEKDSAVFEHGADKVPLYVAHLEYGLRLPLPPFVRRICERLGVSLMQLAPNAIATMMAFLVICHRVGVELTLQLFSNLVSVKTIRKDAHFFFVNLGAKLVSIPESNKDWKEKFVWVFGADLILVCRSWLEIKKEALKQIVLSAEERQDLEKIRSYAGSRDISDLFETASLRVAGLSHTQPMEADRERAALLAKAAPKLPKDPKALSSAKLVAPQLPLKRVRTALSAKEAEFWNKNPEQMVAMLTAQLGVSREGEPEKKKKRVKKPAPKEKLVATAPDLAGAAIGGTSGLIDSQASKPVPPPSLPVEVVIVDESSQGANKAQEIPPADLDSRVEPATTTVHPPKSICGLDKESAVVDGAAMEMR